MQGVAGKQGFAEVRKPWKQERVWWSLGKAATGRAFLLRRCSSAKEFSKILFLALGFRKPGKWNGEARNSSGEPNIVTASLLARSNDGVLLARERSSSVFLHARRKPGIHVIHRWACNRANENSRKVIGWAGGSNRKFFYIYQLIHVVFLEEEPNGACSPNRFVVWCLFSSAMECIRGRYSILLGRGRAQRSTTMEQGQPTWRNPHRKKENWFSVLALRWKWFIAGGGKSGRIIHETQFGT
jgi:hypothetical protein